MRIETRKWRKEDRERLVSMCNAVDRTYLSDRMPNPYKESDGDWWLNMVEESEGKEGVFRAIVVEGEIVGSISVELKQGGLEKAGELGYMILTEYWNRGIASEAVRKTCTEARAILGISRITASVYAPNIASQRVLEKNGFALEGSKSSEKYEVKVYGLRGINN